MFRPELWHASRHTALLTLAVALCLALTTPRTPNHREPKPHSTPAPTPTRVSDSRPPLRPESNLRPERRQAEDPSSQNAKRDATPRFSEDAMADPAPQPAPPR